LGKGKIKHLFPGGNTSVGFYSYYSNIIDLTRATRVFVLKGGPGVGKSTFMRKIGNEMTKRGYDIEHHHCSSDNGSLDGVVIPALGIALIDGTSPHVVDPRYPGAVDEIINLGEYWDEAKLRGSREQIIAYSELLGRLFPAAYRQLAEAKIARDEAKDCVAGCMDFLSVNKITLDLIGKIIEGLRGSGKVPLVRHLFCSAITPDGVKHFIESLLGGIEKLYLIKGLPGSGRSCLVETIARESQFRGLDTEVYHCAFEPRKVDLVIIPEAKSAVLKGAGEVGFEPKTLSDIDINAINLNCCLNQTWPEGSKDRLLSAGQRFKEALNRAVVYLSEAKQVHDHIESFYVPAMNFEAIEKKRNDILQRILGYAQKKNLA